MKTTITNVKVLQGIKEQIETTMEVAKTGNANDLRESIEDLQAKLHHATVIGLKCYSSRMKKKLAVLHATL